MVPRDLRQAVIPDWGISPSEAAILVTYWTTAPQLGALGFRMQYGPDSGWLYGLASNPLRDL
jgi:hypothetical protein